MSCRNLCRLCDAATEFGTEICIDCEVNLNLDEASMKLSDAFPSKYITHADLNGNEIPVTITHVTQEQMRDGTPKLIAYFTKGKKGLALNRTNASRIAAKFGDDTDQWEGAQIVLFPDVTDFGGKPTDCIRVRVPTQTRTTAKRAAPPPRDEEEPPIPDDDSVPF